MQARPGRPSIGARLLAVPLLLLACGAPVNATPEPPPPREAAVVRTPQAVASPSGRAPACAAALARGELDGPCRACLAPLRDCEGETCEPACRACMGEGVLCDGVADLSTAWLDAPEPGTPLPAGALARLGDPSLRRVAALALSPDGRALVVSMGGALYVADPSTRRIVRRLAGSAARPGSGYRSAAMRFSPDGRAFAAESQGEVRVWRMPLGALVDRFRVSEEPGTQVFFAFDVSPDSRWLAVGWARTRDHPASGGVVLRSLVGQPERRFERAQGPLSLAFAPDATSLAIGEQGTIAIVDLEGRARSSIATGPSRATSLRWPRADRLLAAWAGTANVIDVGRGAILRTLDVAIEGNMLMEVVDRTLLTAACDARIRQWNLEDGRELGAIEIADDSWHHLMQRGGCSPMVAQALQASGGRLVVLVGGVVSTWDLDGRAPVSQAEGHGARVAAVAFDASAGRILSASLDGTVRLWTREGEAWRSHAYLTDHASAPRAVAFAPDGGFVAAGSSGDARSATATVWRWPTPAATPTTMLAPPGARGSWDDVGVDVRGRVWAATTNAVVVYEGTRARQTTPDGFVVASDGERLVLWPTADLTTTSVRELSGRTVFDALVPAAGGYGDCRLAGPRLVCAGAALRTCDARGCVSHPHPPAERLGAVSADGSLALVGQAVFDTTSGAAVWVLDAGGDPITAASFGPDVVATGHESGLIHLWSTRP